MRFSIGFMALALVVGLVTGLYPAPVLIAADNPQKLAEENNAAAENALAAGDLKSALNLFSAAARADSQIPLYPLNAAMAAAYMGDSQIAAQWFRKAAAVAVVVKDFRTVAEAQQRLAELLGAWPAWALEREATAGAPLTAADQQLLVEWQAQMQAASERAAGSIEKAIVTTRSALKTAQNHFGDNHPATLSSLSFLADLHLALQQVDKAAELLRRAQTGYQQTLGAEHPQTTGTIKRRADLLLGRGEAAQAIELYRRVLAINRKSLGEDHLETLAVRQALGLALQQSADSEVAETQLRQALAGYRNLLGEDHYLTIVSLEHLAQRLLAGLKYTEAEKALIRARDLKVLIFGPSAPETVHTANQLAETYRLQGQFPEAEALLKRNLAHAQSFTKMPPTITADTRTRLALVYEDQGRYPQAEVLYREVLAFWRKFAGAQHPEAAVMQSNLGNLYRRMGQFPSAEELLTRALKTMRGLYGDQAVATVNVMNNLALLYENMGLYDLAEPLFKDAIRFAKARLGAAAKRDRDVWNMLNNLALLHEAQGVFHRAEPLYREVLLQCDRHLGPDHPRTLAGINNLAYLYMLKQDYPRAADYFERVLQRWTAGLGPGHQHTLKALNNLGRVHYRQGKLQQARAELQEAMEQREMLLGSTHIDTLRSKIDMSGVLLSQGELAAAESLLTEAIPVAEAAVGVNHPYVFEMLNRLADIKAAQEDLQASFGFRKTVFERRNLFFDRVLWATGENARDGYIRLHQHELDALLTLLSRPEFKNRARWLLEVGLKRKGLLLKTASEIAQISRLAEAPETRRTARALMDRKKKLAALTLSGPVDMTATTYLAEIGRLEADIEDLQGQLGRSARLYRRAGRTVSAKDVVQRLTDDEALVEFLIYTDTSLPLNTDDAPGDRQRLVAVVVQRNRQNKERFDVVHYGPLAPISKGVQLLREVIQDEDAEEEDLLDEAQYRYDEIWGPLLPYIQDKTVVYLVPDGLLNVLPFEALMDPEESYLLQTYDVRLLTSARELVADAPGIRSQDYFIVAGPDYDADFLKTTKVQIENRRKRSLGSERAGEINQSLRMTVAGGLRGMSFDPLPGAEKEGLTIAKLSRQSRPTIVFSQKEGEEQKLREMASPPGVLHLATHGFFLKPDEKLLKRLLKNQRGGGLQIPPPGDNPLLRAGLAFAGINANAAFLGEIDTDNDGVLTALEVLALNLDGTGLVVLSACETGLGEIHEGEGVYGLRRAFQEAGAARVVNSLWEVSDAGTQTLMTAMYDRILSGQPAREAFREARLEMMAHETWYHPYYWSAFVMVGN